MRVIALVLAGGCIVGAQPTFRSGVELVTIHAGLCRLADNCLAQFVSQ